MASFLFDVLTPNPTIPTFAFDTVCHPWADGLGWTGGLVKVPLHPFKTSNTWIIQSFFTILFQRTPFRS